MQSNDHLRPAIDATDFWYQNGSQKKLRLATRKHRIGVRRIISVIANAHTEQPVTTERGEAGVFFQGFDDRGREIEVIVVEHDGFDLVIHAMPVDYRERT